MNYIFGNKKEVQPTDHYVFTLKDIENEDILEKFYHEILNIPDDKPIHLFIETAGGSAIYTDKICRLIYKRQHPVRAIVKKYAHSAGAIIALAAQELEIEENATLSSIDPQIQFPKTQMGIKDIAFIFDKNLDTTLNNIGICYKKFNDYYLWKMRTWIHPRHDVEKIIHFMYEEVSCHGELFYPEDLDKFGVKFNYYKK